MRVTSLQAVGWRNLAPLTLSFPAESRLTVFFGDNGQGKTNLLEALHYLATTRSFRTRDATSLIQYGASHAALQTHIEQAELTRQIDLRLSLSSRQFLLDGKPVRRLGAFVGSLSVVLFVPEDLLLPRATPAARRRFLDAAVFGVERVYWGELSAFQKVLRSRNALLRQPGASSTLLDTYDEQLARLGARIVARRRTLTEELAPAVQRYFRALHADKVVDVTYRSHAEVMGVASEVEVDAALLEGLRRRRVIDQRRGHTTFGPQTDDLDLALDGRPAGEHASQGQLRSLVLSLKLAELAHRDGRLGEPPILLLDDVPSELDPARRRYLFETLAELSCQTLISVADRSVVPSLPSRADFEVRSGHVTAS